MSKTPQVGDIVIHSSGEGKIKAVSQTAGRIAVTYLVSGCSITCNLAALTWSEAVGAWVLKP